MPPLFPIGSLPMKAESGDSGLKAPVNGGLPAAIGVAELSVNVVLVKSVPPPGKPPNWGSWTDSGTLMPVGPTRKISRSLSNVIEISSVTVTLVTTWPAGTLTVTFDVAVGPGTGENGKLPRP